MKALSLALFCLCACASNSAAGPATEVPTNEVEAPQPPAETPLTCDAARECGACMNIAGCSWTPEGCSSGCLMDTWCVDPGNACPALPEGLLGSWQEDHSRRAQQARVFVSAELDLGPARYRQRYTFRADGSAEISVLAPNDAHYSVSGTWSVAPGSEIVVRYETREGEARFDSWTVAVSEGVLTLTALPDPAW